MILFKNIRNFIKMIDFHKNVKQLAIIWNIIAINNK